MTDEDGKQVARNFLKQFCREAYPYVWVGEPYDRDSRGFIVDGTIYADGEDPTKDTRRIGVDFKTKTADFFYY